MYKVIGSLLLSFWLLAGCTHQPERNDRNATTQHLSRLLKGLDPDIPTEESRALSREIMTRSAALERTFHRTTLPWIHNLMVNIGLRQKGLCYQYADGLYYDLRFNHYPHFSFHLAGAHIGEYWREHNTLVVTAKDGRVEDGVVVDPWRATGKVFVARLKDDRAYTWKHRPEREIKNVAACRVAQSGT